MFTEFSFPPKASYTVWLCWDNSDNLGQVTTWNIISLKLLLSANGGCRSYCALLWKMVNSATPWEIHWFSYCLSWGQYNKTFTSEISTSEVIILGSENSSHTFFFTLFNEFITGCIPQVVGTQVWDATYCNQPITTLNAKL